MIQFSTATAGAAQRWGNTGTNTLGASLLGSTFGAAIPVVNADTVTVSIECGVAGPQVVLVRPQWSDNAIAGVWFDHGEPTARTVAAGPGSLILRETTGLLEWEILPIALPPILLYTPTVQLAARAPFVRFIAYTSGGAPAIGDFVQLTIRTRGLNP